MPDTKEVDPDTAPVVGEPVSVSAVELSTEAVDAAHSRAKSRTGQQAFSAGAVVTIGVWVLRLAGADLNPLPDQEEIPGEVIAAWTATLTYLAAVWMNRR